MAPTLHGYKYSVYAWIARLALHEKGVAYAWREVNPFGADVPEDYQALHPFGRVPVLVAGDFAIYETGAITQYVDEAFAGPSLQPAAARDRARVRQIVSIIDSYGYWPLVRQVFAHGVIGPRLGRPSGAGDVRAGLEAAPRVLNALEALAGPGVWLIDDAFSLADIHLAPMLAYFTMHPEGAGLLEARPRLARWSRRVSQRPAFSGTRPALPPPA